MTDESRTGLDPQQASATVLRIVADASKEADDLGALPTDPDRSPAFLRPGLSRMRTEWQPGDAPQVTAVIRTAEGRIRQLFPDAYQLMNEIWTHVRRPVADAATGEFAKDEYGWPVWERAASGAPIEDFSRLTLRQRDDYLFRITTSLFEWEQRCSTLWLEAMLAKGVWEEAMATGFVAPSGRVTVEERLQRGRINAVQDRYHAIFRTHLSRSAEALVRSMTLLGQRLKDSMA